jgi:DNA primase large subunit
MPTTYRQKNYDRGRWEQEDFERVINAFKEKAVGICAASRALKRRIIQYNKKSLGPAECIGTDAEMKMLSHASCRFCIEQKRCLNSHL